MNTVDYWACSDQGTTRDENQDAIVIGSLHSTAVRHLSVSGSYSVPPAGAVIAVIDGMGGHANGAEAAQVVAAEIAITDENTGGIRGSLERSNASIYKVFPSIPAPGAACSGIFVTATATWLFSIGDTRAYHCVGDAMTLITTDQTDSQGLLTDSIGGRDRPTSINPEIRQVDIRTGDRVLLCSDGISSTLRFDQLNALLASGAGADQFVEEALSAGSSDNATVVLAAFR